MQTAWWSALLPLIGTVIGSAISVVVTVISMRSTLRNQMVLEERRFEYQRQLESEKREHEAGAFRRALLRDFRRLDNVSSLDAKHRTSLPRWEKTAAVVRDRLNDPDAAKSLSEAQFHAAWAAQGEAEAAIMFIRLWNDGARVQVAILSIEEYLKALASCFELLGDQERAETAGARIGSDWSKVGIRFELREFDRVAVGVTGRALFLSPA